MRNSKRNLFLKSCCHVIFIVYIIFLIKIILFKYKGLITTFDNLMTGELSGFRSFNIIPFRSIWEFGKLMFRGYFSRGFNNIIGNIFVFAPFGYLIPFLYKKCEKWKIVAAIGLFASLFLELSQYFLYLGSADIDDVILNLLGVALGFLFFRGIRKITDKKETERYVITIVLSAVGFIVAGYLAVDYFGIMFGITNQRNRGGLSDGGAPLPVEFESREQIDMIPHADSDEKQQTAELDDIYGLITELDDSRIVINRIEEKDLGNGVGIASVNMADPKLQTIYLTDTTKYTQKDIYDVNGDRVEIRDAAKEDLEVDKNINIKGYLSDGKFYAAEIEMENFLFA